MDVLAYDVSPRSELASKLAFEYTSMDRLLADSDIISLHVPLKEHTHHLISTEAFDRMKEGVVIINTARGPIIDIQALLQANHILLHQRNVVITPHSAFNTTEAVQRILDVTVENIRSFFEGMPKNLVLDEVA